MTRGGEVFVTKMPVMRILDLAQAMIALLAPAYGFAPKEISIEFVGVRSGEKLYEELLTEEEMDQTLEIERMFVVLPSLQNVPVKINYSYNGLVERTSLQHQYISAEQVPMTVKEIKHFLLANGILGDLVKEPRPERRLQGHRHLELVTETRMRLA